MKRALRNLKPFSVSNIFRGSKLTFGSKGVKVFDMKDEEERAEYYFWKTRYGSIIDTPGGEDT